MVARTVLLFGILVPALVAGVWLLLARAPWRRRSKRMRAAGLALAAASIAGYLGVMGLPPFPFGERTLNSQQWRFYTTIVVALAAAGLLRVKVEPLRWVGLFVAFAIGLRGVLDGQFRNHWDFNAGWGWVGAFAALTSLLAACLAFHARRPGIGRPILLTLWVAAIAVGLTLGRVGSTGQLAGAVAAGLGAFAVVAMMRRDDTALEGVGAVLAFLAASFTLEGYYFAYVPLWASVIFAAVPLLLTVAELPPLARGGGTVLTPLQWLLVVIPCGVALWLTWSENGGGASDYPY